MSMVINMITKKVTVSVDSIEIEWSVDAWPKIIWQEMLNGAIVRLDQIGVPTIWKETH